MTSEDVRLKIVYVTLQGLEEGQGAATHVRATVTGLNRTDDVTLCAPRATEAPSAHRRLLRMARVQWVALQESRRSDVVYMRHHPLLLVLAMLLRISGTPAVQELNGPIEDYGTIYPVLRPLLGILRHMTVRSLLAADAVVVVSDRLKQYLIDLGVPPDHIEVVHNGADLNRFQPSPDEPGSYAVFLGALTPWQGLQTLTGATRHPAWPKGVPLVVVGVGPTEGVLDAGDPQVIQRRGVVSHAHVADLLSGALVSLSPKTAAATWSSPLKLYESVACGVPVIATEIGEQADFIRQWGCGLVVAENDPQALATAVATVADNADLREELAVAAKAARDHVSWDQRVKQLRSLLYSVSARKPNGQGVTAWSG